MGPELTRVGSAEQFAAGAIVCRAGAGDPLSEAEDDVVGGDAFRLRAEIRNDAMPQHGQGDGAHVFGGVVMLSVVLYRGMAGQFSGRHYDAVEGASLYWHFVDVVWILLFSLLYLLPGKG